MNYKNLLIIGGCGFVGSNLAIYFKISYPGSNIIVLDNLKRSGSELNLARLKINGIEFIHGDIRNKEDFNQIKNIDFIIDAAAEPSVLAGLFDSPDYLINTNLIGTINCLNFAVKNNAKLIFLSTSRVYPFKLLDDINFIEDESRFNITPNQSLKGISSNGVTVDFPITGARSIYGATKLASELLITEYVEFLNLNAIINRCGVITGPWQMGKVDQGVIVLWLAKHYWKKELTYNGYGGFGKQVRDILHIHDLFRLIDIQINNFEILNSKTFNVGGGLGCSLSLLELTEFCQKITGNSIPIKPLAENRKADTRIYITDNQDVSVQTGWSPKYKPEKILLETFEWLKTNELLLQNILN
jgi:CDP-paratose 2-epimerase